MKKWLLWGIPAIALIALLVWRFSVRGAANAQVAGQQGARRNASAAVEVASVASRVIVQSLQSVGNVESPYKVEISPKSAGRISFLEVRAGDPVKAGQVLLKIDPSDLQGAVNQALAGVAEARSRLAEAKITQGANAVGVTSQIRQQVAAVASAQADLNQVQRNFDSQVQTAQAQLDAADSAVKNALANLTQENASLANAQTKYNRTLNLYQQRFIAAQDLDDARTAVDVQKGAVAVASGQVDAAKSQLKVQNQNLAIVKRKGQADIAASKAKLTQSKALLDVATANRSQTPAYKENLAALQSAVDAAVGQLNQAQSRLKDTAVRSSINGTVTDRKADPGALASPGTPVLEVQFLDWLFVTTTLPIEASSDVHEGQTADITFDALPGKKLSGTIVNLNPAADPLNRQFGISVRLENPDHSLRPGMYGRVSVVTSKVNASAVVPREALKTNSDGSSTVTTVDKDSVAHVVPVQVGVSDDTGVQITGGVQKGDKVVILSYTPVKDKQKVTIGGPGGGTSGKSGAGRRGRGAREGQAAPGGGGGRAGGGKGAGGQGGAAGQ